MSVEANKTPVMGVDTEAVVDHLDEFAGALLDLLTRAVNRLSLVEILGVLEVAKFEVQVAARQGAA